MPSSKGKRTDPELAEKIKEEVKNEEKGGGKGSWSAWKAGEMARRYEAAGGGYENQEDSKNEPKKGAPQKKEGAEKGIHATKKADGSKAKKGGSKPKTGDKRKKDDEEEDEEEGAEDEEKEEFEDAEEPAEEAKDEEQDEEAAEDEEPPKKKGKTAEGKAAPKKAAAKKSGGKSETSGEDQEIIDQFNEYVNMTADELKEWLAGDDSQGAGWTGAKGDGETVGHESGRKIVEILESNPDKDPEQYTSDQLAHMKKVNAYCKRHLAQEDKLKDSKSPEELEQTSTKSLKNWGHDPLKTL